MWSNVYSGMPRSQKEQRGKQRGIQRNIAPRHTIQQWQKLYCVALPESKPDFVSCGHMEAANAEEKELQENV